MRQAELKALENVTSDSNKVLSEKLALAREMSSLKPELEHLRAQSESNQELLAEKLSLDRQLKTMQVELENEKRSSARLAAKQSKKAEQDEDLYAELEELRKELAKERRDRSKAETALERAEEALVELRSNLDMQTRAAKDASNELKKAEKEAAKAKQTAADKSELDGVRNELVQEKKGRRELQERLQNEVADLKIQLAKAVEGNKKMTEDDGADTCTHKEVIAEQQENQRAQKQYQKTLSELRSRNELLDEKLAAFREKLKSTKEKLKTAEEELHQAHTVKLSIEPLAQKGRKRLASSLDPDATMGTPGDGAPAKRMKRAQSVTTVGDKSTFSMTPFFNRTASIAPDSPAAASDEHENQDTQPAGHATPMARATKATRKRGPAKPMPLAPSASGKANARARVRKKAVAPKLDKVAEESDQGADTAGPAQAKDHEACAGEEDAGAATAGQKMVPKLKPGARRAGPGRKSLMSFAAFSEEASAVEPKKKRKLAGAGVGKTLFDADEDAGPAKAVPGKGAFAARALGKSLLSKGSRPISGGFKMMTEDGFQFSPLKKDRPSAPARE